jgi:integrase
MPELAVSGHPAGPATGPHGASSSSSPSTFATPTRAQPMAARRRRSSSVTAPFAPTRFPGSSSPNYLVAEAAGRAGLLPVHPHMLRHSCGFALANRGYDLRLIQDYLGHRDPKHTVTTLASLLAVSRVSGGKLSKRGHFAHLRCHWAEQERLRLRSEIAETDRAAEVDLPIGLGR